MQNKQVGECGSTYMPVGNFFVSLGCFLDDF